MQLTRKYNRISARLVGVKLPGYAACRQAIDTPLTATLPFLARNIEYRSVYQIFNILFILFLHGNNLF